jgi:hypothetical protein
MVPAAALSALWQHFLGIQFHGQGTKWLNHLSCPLEDPPATTLLRLVATSQAAESGNCP